MTDTKKETQVPGVAMNQGGVAIKHGPGPVSGRPRRLHDLIEEDSPSVYVRSNATKITKKVSHVLIPHKSSQSGDTITIEIPNTFIPIDLANYAPKEELLKNPTLMKTINSGLLTLLSVEEAEAELATPAAILETQRLMAEAQRRMGATLANEGQEDGPMRTMLTPGANPQTAASGDIDGTTAGVSAAVANLFGNAAYSDDDRVVALRNLEPTLTDTDRRYIRGRSNDARIREITG